MLNDIVLLIVGGIGGIMTKGVANEASAMMGSVKAGKDAYVAPPVQAVMMGEWTPPPPPTNPPYHLEPDEDRAAIAAARESTRGA
jgi:hypothetical protein